MDLAITWRHCLPANNDFLEVALFFFLSLALEQFESFAGALAFMSCASGAAVGGRASVGCVQEPATFPLELACDLSRWANI